MKATLSDISIYSDEKIILFGHEWKFCKSGKCYNDYQMIGGDRKIRVSFDKITGAINTTFAMTAKAK